MTSFCYVLPLIIFIPYIILLFSSKAISESTYSIVFISLGLYLGYLFYIFHICLILHLINIIYSLSFTVNAIIMYIIPLIICV